jgi:hypothetical protein
MEQAREHYYTDDRRVYREKSLSCAGGKYGEQGGCGPCVNLPRREGEVANRSVKKKKLRRMF